MFLNLHIYHQKYFITIFYNMQKTMKNCMQKTMKNNMVNFSFICYNKCVYLKIEFV